MSAEKVEKIPKEYHKQRRIFAIINGQLNIARGNFAGSHDEWFIRNSWIKNKSDPVYEKITRGMLDPKENLYFYVGEDLRLTPKAEKEFFSILNKLVKELGIKKETKIFGGMIRGEKGIPWPGRKYFGKIEDFI